MRSHVATPEQIRTTVDRYIERWSSGERQAWLELFAPDATVEDPIGSDVRQGAGELTELWDLVHGLADRLQLVRTGPTRVAGHEAAFPMQAITASGGTELEVDIIDVMTFDDDARITSMRAYWDAAEMRVRDI
jgi:steroid delta-isomerase